ncbi:MAG: 3-deoxy-manno-octulosonate cytidylyltransferase [Kiritimatiellae bacterium]|nr:3-deoxy-manno-octulosonate cytidylyltransferase [Kiritimatiellia bacterium]
MHILGVIPSRYGSTRLPGKSLVPLCGKPLVQWVYERAKQARALDELVVATDDQRIADAVARFGGKAVMTRSDHPSGTDRVAEAAASMQADIVVNVQGDEPLIDPRAIDAVCRAMDEDASWDMATPAAPVRTEAEIGDPAVVKVVWDQEGRALYFSRSPIPFVREKGGDAAGADPLYWRHIGLYAYRRGFLEKLVGTPPCALEEAEKLEQLRALHIGARMKVVKVDAVGPSVDTPEDVAKAERALKAAGLA